MILGNIGGLVVLVVFFVVAIPVASVIFAVTLRARVFALELQIANLSDFLKVLELKFQRAAFDGNEVVEPSESGNNPIIAAKRQEPDVISESASIREIGKGANDTGPDPDKSSGRDDEAEAATGDVESELYGNQENVAAVAEPAARKGRSAADFEKLIGERWTVILGGIAIALGAVFLVRYTIEVGLLGPRTRIALGFALAAALFTGGEWLRRYDRKLDISVFEKADIPGILTGVGSIAAFATIYAAHALYGFVGPGIAFTGLTVTGLATLVLAIIHGPKLAAFGVLGSYATPILVSSSTPNPMVLSIHILIVTACVMAMARVRGWLWLAYAGIIGATFWTMMAANVYSPSTGLAGAILLVGLAIVYAGAFAWKVEERLKPSVDLPIQRVALVAFASLTVGFLVQLAVNVNLPGVPTGLLLAMIMIGVVAYSPANVPVAVVGGFVVTLTVLKIQLPLVDLPGMNRTADLVKGMVPPDISGYVQSVAMVAVPPALFAIYEAWRANTTARLLAGWLASTASGIAFLAILISYLRIAPFETRMVFGLIATGAAAGFAALTESFSRQRADDLTAPAPAAFAVAAVSLVSFAIAVSFSKGWMPLGFAMASLAIAFVYSRRSLWIIARLSVAAAVLSGIALYFNAPYAQFEIGSTPFLNSLIPLVALPAFAILAGGHLMRRNGAEREGAATMAIGMAAFGLFVGMEIRHWLTDGDIASSRVSLEEMAAQSIAALSFAIGLQRLARYTSDTLFDKAALVAGGLGALMLVFGLLIVHNPLFVPASIGQGAFFNLLLPAYLISGILAAIVAYMARPIRPRWYTLNYAALSGLLLFVYPTAMMRHYYQGEFIYLSRSTSDQELWSYSAVWLLLGGLVLAAGVRLSSLPIRAASGILIGLTICKVFLFDLSELTGAMRAFSFLGLGASLLIIGRFYQRLLRKQDRGEQDDAADLDEAPTAT